MLSSGGALGESDRTSLAGVLLVAQREGLVGPGAVDAHLDHAIGFAEVIGDAGAVGLDLGSGAGVPGLVLAMVRPSTAWLLVDGRRRSAAFLERVTAELGIDERVTVVEARAEDAARTALRGAVDLVVARGMGSPGATAECAAGFLRVGGRLVVSEPPDADDRRWTTSGLKVLGMGPPAPVASSFGTHFVVITQEHECPDRFPRRVGQPAKRPLF